MAHFGAEIHAYSGFSGAQLVADLSITTVAALVPPDFKVVLCDEHLSNVDLDADVDFVGITGKTSQASRLVEYKYRSTPSDAHRTVAGLV